MRETRLVAVATGLFLCAAVLIGSCVHEIPAPVTKDPTGNGPGDTPTLVKCSADTIYFEQQVLPLVASLCGKSGCHGSINPREFRLIYSSEAQSYQAIRNRFSSNSALVHALNEMAEQDVSGYLPPTSDQLSVLQKWISQGGRNNSCNSCDTTQYTFALNVAPLIKYYCSGCHSTSGSSTTPNLSTLAAIKSELQNYPGRLLGSIEWTAPYNTTTARMPQGSNQLSECERKVIRKWIEAGALDN